MMWRLYWSGVSSLSPFLYPSGANESTVVAFVFTFYVLSFFFDLRPKARTKKELRQETIEYQEASESNRGGFAQRVLSRTG
jgi:hypothetical protein